MQDLFKQFKVPLLLVLIGFLFTILGAWLKIMHMAFADFVLTAGMILKGIGVIIAIIILVKNK